MSEAGRKSSSSSLFGGLRALAPKMSPTEREALEAGTVWVEGEIFSGRPDLGRLLEIPYPDLDPRERAFLDGPVEEVCRRVDEWELGRTRRLPEEIWETLRNEGFFGLAIPPEHGGLGFSSLGRSAVFAKLATRSLALSAVVLIPNSVGPGELLLDYGTEEQKRHWLPRLARGEEIPCFALTEPEAGSDAAALTSHGEVFRGEDGELGLRLDWEKRYITLAPVATLLGLAFRLSDPDDLLGRGGGDLGITVALVPTDLPGVEIGRRHDPMGIPMPNGPTRGRGVVVPLDAVLGGAEHAGRGWRMLMEALSAGRAVSLPAQSVGGAKKLARTVGAYASVRRQFGIEIARFEGIEEPLAEIAGTTYLLEAARVATCGAIDAGERPAVVSAIVKYQTTGLLRELLARGMDVLAGTAICRGPRNPLGDAWRAVPIGITVEGANILTRSLIVFGQGAIRAHPYARRELDALAAGDAGGFARVAGAHLVHLGGNLLRLAGLELTRARLVRAPGARATARHQRRLVWASARFAVLADLALLTLGSRLKRREKLSGRFADALSWIFLAAVTLRRFEAEGRPEEDLPLVSWAAETALACVQEATEGIAADFGGPLGPLLSTLGAFWIRLQRLGRPPSDRLGSEAAARLRLPGEPRERLTGGVYVGGADEADGRLELAFRLAGEAAEPRERVVRAQRSGRLPAGVADGEAVLGAAVEAGVIDEPEAALLARAAEARREATAVDSFSAEEYFPDAAPRDVDQADAEPEPATSPTAV